LQAKIENLEGDAKLNAKLLQRTNQPQSYVLNDLANAEKKIDYAERKIKSLEDSLRKVTHENNQLKLAKKSMQEDIHKQSTNRTQID
jgi:regulator of replication initiation timing